MSNFQEELIAEGYENTIIIAVGQTNIQAFNGNFCNNSDLPLVMDPYPGLPIRAAFGGLHKEVVIIDTDESILGRVTLSSGLNNTSKNLIRDIIAANYQMQIDGDINSDQMINIQDIILSINLILANEYNEAADLNNDNALNVLDIVQLVNIILS